jgi:hypothetical protein
MNQTSLLLILPAYLPEPYSRFCTPGKFWAPIECNRQLVIPDVPSKWYIYSFCRPARVKPQPPAQREGWIMDGGWRGNFFSVLGSVDNHYG